jgi:chromosomal replication initiation ATPase DnaA
VSIKANRFAASLEEVLRVLSHHAIKYKQEYGKIPVLIIDNANRLAEKQQELLNLFQDYAKDAADKGRVTVVFVSSDVPRRMMGKSIMFIVLL